MRGLILKQARSRHASRSKRDDAGPLTDTSARGRTSRFRLQPVTRSACVCSCSDSVLPAGCRHPMWRQRSGERGIATGSRRAAGKITRRPLVTIWQGTLMNAPRKVRKSIRSSCRCSASWRDRPAGGDGKLQRDPGLEAPGQGPPSPYRPSWRATCSPARGAPGRRPSAARSGSLGRSAAGPRARLRGTRGRGRS